MQRNDYITGSKDYEPRAGLKSYGFGPKGASQAEKDATSSLGAEAHERLTKGDSLLPQPMESGFSFDKRLMEPSGLEKVGGWLGAGLGAHAGLRNAADTKGMSDGDLLTIAQALKRLGVEPKDDTDA